jgi:hypothetical protein
MSCRGGGRLLCMDPVVVRLSAPITSPEASALCAAIRQRLATGASRTVVCHVLGPVDLSVVGVVARMQLMSRRLRTPLQIRTWSPALSELLALTGLDEVVPVRLEPGGQPEPREQPRIEEVVDVDDLPS